MMMQNLDQTFCDNAATVSERVGDLGTYLSEKQNIRNVYSRFSMRWQHSKI